MIYKIKINLVTIVSYLLIITVQENINYNHNKIKDYDKTKKFLIKINFKIILLLFNNKISNFKTRIK